LDVCGRFTFVGRDLPPGRVLVEGRDTSPPSTWHVPSPSPSTGSTRVTGLPTNRHG
jgi:hypothetical protein